MMSFRKQILLISIRNLYSSQCFGAVRIANLFDISFYCAVSLDCEFMLAHLVFSYFLFCSVCRIVIFISCFNIISGMIALDTTSV